MDPCDEASRLSEQHLAACLARRSSAALMARADGRCACCGGRIPEARRLTGAATCIKCQIQIESGELEP
jgi:RNA polymerase-binding transcription factor DksA